MELRVKIDYDELLKLVQQLPKDQITKLKAELEKLGVQKRVQSEKQNLKELALSGPVMMDKQFTEYQSFREHMNKWRGE